MVIGIFRESQWIEAQGINHRLAEQTQIRLHGAQLRQVEGDQVVTEQEGNTGRQCVQCNQSGTEIARRISQGLIIVTAQRR